MRITLENVDPTRPGSYEIKVEPTRVGQVQPTSLKVAAILNGAAQQLLTKLVNRQDEVTESASKSRIVVARDMPKQE